MVSSTFAVQMKRHCDFDTTHPTRIFYDYETIIPVQQKIKENMVEGSIEENSVADKREGNRFHPKKCHD